MSQPGGQASEHDRGTVARNITAGQEARSRAGAAPGHKDSRPARLPRHHRSTQPDGTPPVGASGRRPAGQACGSAGAGKQTHGETLHIRLPRRHLRLPPDVANYDQRLPLHAQHAK
jgi:hypothetical protein